MQGNPTTSLKGWRLCRYSDQRRQSIKTSEWNESQAYPKMRASSKVVAALVRMEPCRSESSTSQDTMQEREGRWGVDGDFETDQRGLYIVLWTSDSSESSGIGSTSIDRSSWHFASRSIVEVIDAMTERIEGSWREGFGRELTRGNVGAADRREVLYGRPRVCSRFSPIFFLTSILNFDSQGSFTETDLSVQGSRKRKPGSRPRALSSGRTCSKAKCYMYTGQRSTYLMYKIRYAVAIIGWTHVLDGPQLRHRAHDVLSQIQIPLVTWLLL